MCDNQDLAKMKIEYQALQQAYSRTRAEYHRRQVDVLDRMATLKEQIMSAEGERRLRVVK